MKITPRPGYGDLANALDRLVESLEGGGGITDAAYERRDEAKVVLAQLTQNGLDVFLEATKRRRVPNGGKS